jgi:hypothetical protein
LQLTKMARIVAERLPSAIRIINARHAVENLVACKPSLIARFIRGGADPIGILVVWIKAARPATIDIIDGGPH